MNSKKVIEKLKRLYPGKNIIKNREENPTEIICEIEPSSEHSEKSIAIAVIDTVYPHYHAKSIEIYEIIDGTLFLNVDGKEHVLNKGEKFKINPGEIHFAKGKETWVKVFSSPGWILKDHILI